MMRIALPGCLLALVACGKDSPTIGQDWSGKPLTATTETLEDDLVGPRKATFSIELPAGMKKEVEKGRIEWRADLKDEWSEPFIGIHFAVLPSSPEDALSSTMPDADDVIVKKEALPDGFLVVSHTKTKGIVRAETWKKIGEKEALTCRASQAKDGGVPNPEKTLAWLEKICVSLKPQ